MGRVTGKYMRVEYIDGEDKTCSHTASLPYLTDYMNFHTKLLFSCIFMSNTHDKIF